MSWVKDRERDWITHPSSIDLQMPSIWPSAKVYQYLQNIQPPIDSRGDTPKDKADLSLRGSHTRTKKSTCYRQTKGYSRQEP